MWLDGQKQHSWVALDFCQCWVLNESNVRHLAEQWKAVAAILWQHSICTKGTFADERNLRTPKLRNDQALITWSHVAQCCTSINTAHFQGGSCSQGWLFLFALENDFMHHATYLQSSRPKSEPPFQQKNLRSCSSQSVHSPSDWYPGKLPDSKGRRHEALVSPRVSLQWPSYKRSDQWGHAQWT